MPEPLTTYYQFAQLSMAAYGTFPLGPPLISTLTSPTVGFSQSLAENFRSQRASHP